MSVHDLVSRKRPVWHTCAMGRASEKGACVGTVVLIIKLLNWPVELHADESAQMMACAGKG